MAKRRIKRDIDAILSDWPHEPGEFAARFIKGQDGRPVLQMRLDMGILQMEVEGRPDGTRPGGVDTYYDFLVEKALDEGDGFVMDDDQYAEVDREFVQFYHRRTCWLALREFRRAVRDANHTLSLMDFTREHSDDEDWTLSHEQYRPFVLFHHTQATALAELEESGPESAIAAINEGLEDFKRLFARYDADDYYEDDELVRKLTELRESLREHYHVGQTLHEQLASAIKTEQYERAAEIRDEIEKHDTV